MELTALAWGLFMAEAILLMVLMMAFSALYAVGLVSRVYAKEFNFVAGVGCVSTDARDVVGDKV